MNIIIAIPEVSISSPGGSAIITSTTFELTYTFANIPNNYTLELSQIQVTTQATKVITKDCLNENSVTVDSPITNGNYSYLLTILNESGQRATTANIADAYTTITIPKPTLKVVNTNTNAEVYSNGISYTYFYFNATGGYFQFTNSPAIPSIDILLVGGGGAGGNVCNNVPPPGGGGAGAYVTAKMNSEIGQTYNITIGSGGSGWDVGCNNGGRSGETSNISGGGYTLYAYGGCGGGSYNQRQGTKPGDNWGSTGGVCGIDQLEPYEISDDDNTNTELGSIWTSFEYSRNTGGVSDIWGGGGTGGGGAGAVGGNPRGVNGGNGGSGKQWLDEKYYAGGGGGIDTVAPGGSGGAGGQGGGGAGYYNALPNTGGGGGGSNGNNSGGDGGSGICVIRLPTNSFFT